MAPVRSQPEVGSPLRRWRERRRLTQLELALDAGISARHLSFVSPFLPWAGVAGTDRTGFELLTVGDVILPIVGLAAIAAALAWGRFGLSVNGGVGDYSLLRGAPLFPRSDTDKRRTSP